MERQNAQATRWLLSTCLVVVLALAAALYPMTRTAWPAVAQTNYVVHISVDGLGAAYLQPLMTAGQVPHFARLFREGAGTVNARADYDWTITLPNHTSQLTGRPVNDKYGVTTSGHRWETNITPALGVTLHNNRGFYVASAFDVAHDNGMSTGLYASKDKFVLFENSYNAANGAADTTGADNGPDKIDTFVNIDLNAGAMFEVFKTNMAANPTRYTFMHFDSADTAGHAYGWGSAQYTAAVVQVDGMLGQVFSLIESVPQMRGNTHIVLTADHGGTGLGHGENWLAINYTVPLVVWGPGIAAGADLYALNGSDTSDPGTGRVDYALGGGQPIRNGDAGNCALRLLGLEAIPGSSLDHLRRVCQLSAPPATSTATATATPTSTPLPYRIFMSIIKH